MPAIALTVKAIQRRVYLKVNTTGIYIYETLTTTWANFVDANYKDEARVTDIADRYALYIYYVKDGQHYHEVKVPLGGLQNCDGDEIIAAIRYFYQQAGYPVG